MTLIELLIAVGVVAVLIGVSVPAIAGARERARVAACELLQRQQFDCLVMYGTSCRDAFPYNLTADGHNPFTGRPIDFTNPYAADGYGVAASNPWDAIRVALGDQSPAGLLCPSDRSSGAIAEHRAAKPWLEGRDVSSYGISISVLLSPEALDPQRPRWDRALLQPQRWNALQLPSQKALVLELAPFHDQKYRRTRPTLNPPWSSVVTAADGASMFRDSDRAVAGVVFPPYARTQVAEQTGRIFTYQFTPYGVRGKDW